MLKHPFVVLASRDDDANIWTRSSADVISHLRVFSYNFEFVSRHEKDFVEYVFAR